MAEKHGGCPFGTAHLLVGQVTSLSADGLQGIFSLRLGYPDSRVLRTGCLSLLRRGRRFIRVRSSYLEKAGQSRTVAQNLAHGDGRNRQIIAHSLQNTSVDEDPHTFLRGTCAQCDAPAGQTFSAASHKIHFSDHNRRATVGCRDFNLRRAPYGCRLAHYADCKRAY